MYINLVQMLWINNSNLEGLQEKERVYNKT